MSITKLNIYYNGWGERWLWGKLFLLENRANSIVFEYSDEALAKGLQLSPLRLPLQTGVFQKFPEYQDYLPGILADCLPDGWGRLLMDRWFRKSGINLQQITALDRLTYLGSNAMGAFSFEPEQSLEADNLHEISLSLLAEESKKIQENQVSDLLNQLVLLGGSPHGARPKVLIYRADDRFSNQEFEQSEPWLVKFPAQNESAEVCAIEQVYAHCAREFGLDVQPSEYFDLDKGLAAFATKRFDRHRGQRIPMHTLAGVLHDNFRIPACDYDTLIRATAHLSRNNQAEIHKAFRQAVFNVVFNNRDDHSKNFSFILNQQQEWRLSPAYDLTFNPGPNGYHQMSVMGEALNIGQNDLLKLAKVAGVDKTAAKEIIENACDVASKFSTISQEILPDKISKQSLKDIQKSLNLRITGVQG